MEDSTIYKFANIGGLGLISHKIEMLPKENSNEGIKALLELAIQIASKIFCFCFCGW